MGQKVYVIVVQILGLDKRSNNVKLNKLIIWLIDYKVNIKCTQTIPYLLFK